MDDIPSVSAQALHELRGKPKHLLKGTNSAQPPPDGKEVGESPTSFAFPREAGPFNDLLDAETLALHGIALPVWGARSP